MVSDAALCQLPPSGLAQAVGQRRMRVFVVPEP